MKRKRWIKKKKKKKNQYQAESSCMTAIFAFYTYNNIIYAFLPWVQVKESMDTTHIDLLFPI